MDDRLSPAKHDLPGLRSSVRGGAEAKSASVHPLKELLWRVSRTAPAPGRGFCYLSVATVFAIFALVTLGGVVRVTESGLGCPDWPLCHGRIIPPFDLHTLIEYSHRLMVVVVTILVISTTVLSWLRHRNRLWIAIPALVGVGLLLLQIVLGGITVLTELSPGLVVAHLAVGQGFFAVYIVVAMAALAARPGRVARSRSKERWYPRLALVIALLLYVAMLSGSFVTTKGAFAACSGWPLCNGSLWPATPLSDIHLFHRYLVALAGIGVVIFAIQTWRTQRPLGGAYIAAVLLTLALVAQVMVGAANIWFGFTSALRALHLAVATTVWGIAVVSVAMSVGLGSPTPATERRLAAQ